MLWTPCVTLSAIERRAFAFSSCGPASGPAITDMSSGFSVIKLIKELADMRLAPCRAATLFWMPLSPVNLSMCARSALALSIKARWAMMALWTCSGYLSALLRRASKLLGFMLAARKLSDFSSSVSFPRASLTMPRSELTSMIVGTSSPDPNLMFLCMPAYTFPVKPSMGLTKFLFSEGLAADPAIPDCMLRMFAASANARWAPPMRPCITMRPATGASPASP